MSPRDAALAALLAAVERLGHDELVVLAEIADRLRLGADQYGKLNIGADGRDWDAEASDELRDFLVYRAIDRLRKARGR